MPHIKEKLGIDEFVLLIIGIVVIFSVVFFVNNKIFKQTKEKITIETIKPVKDFKDLEAEETIEEAVEVVNRRPLKFQKFKVTIEIMTEKPQDDSYVRNKTNKLIGLVKSLSDAKDIEIIKLEGVSIRNNKAFDISLD